MTTLSQIASPLRGRRSRKRIRRVARPVCDVLYQLEALEQRTLLDTEMWSAAFPASTSFTNNVLELVATGDSGTVLASKDSR